MKLNMNKMLILMALVLLQTKWAFMLIKSKLLRGEKLWEMERLLSENKKCEAHLLSGGNFVIRNRETNTKIWETGEPTSEWNLSSFIQFAISL